jgi:hypothetical protein
MKITAEESGVASSRLASLHVRNSWLEPSHNGSVSSLFFQRHGLNASKALL